MELTTDIPARSVAVIAAKLRIRKPSAPGEPRGAAMFEEISLDALVEDGYDVASKYDFAMRENDLVWDEDEELDE